MTDNSDGLVPDLGLMARRSGVRIDLDQAAIGPDPLLASAGAVLDVDPWEWVLTGGEDHTLIGSTPGEPPTGFRAIGTVSKEKFDSVLIDGKPPARDAGWVSF